MSSKSCNCVLHFSKVKKGQRVTGHNNGGKSQLHSQPFTLSKQTRTSLLLIPSVTHTHFQSHTLYSFAYTRGPCQIAELFHGTHWKAPVALYASPGALRPSGASHQLGREWGWTHWWNLGSSILEPREGHSEHKERQRGGGLDTFKALNPHN